MLDMTHEDWYVLAAYDGAISDAYEDDMGDTVTLHELGERFVFYADSVELDFADYSAETIYREFIYYIHSRVEDGLLTPIH